jgi:hypothetical protein
MIVQDIAELARRQIAPNGAAPRFAAVPRSAPICRINFMKNMTKLAVQI